MKRELTAADRLIVAADFKPNPHALNSRTSVRNQIMSLVNHLKDTGVCLKLNSGLRALGYDLIDHIHEHGLTVFADLKLNDIPETLATDGIFLAEARPELLTVMCTAGVKGMQALKAMLPNTEILGVTVLTSMDDADCQAWFDAETVMEGVQRFVRLAMAVGQMSPTVDGFIMSPKEAAVFAGQFEGSHTINTPGIRPTWHVVAGDDQNPDRIMTPAKAASDPTIIMLAAVVIATAMVMVFRTFDQLILTKTVETD